MDSSKASMVYVHVGYPKAASTSLQQNLFKRHSGINFIRHNDIDLAALLNVDPDYSGNLKSIPLQPNYTNVISSEYIIDTKHQIDKVRNIRKLASSVKVIIVIRRQLDAMKSFYYTRAGESLIENEGGKSYPSFGCWVEAHITGENNYLKSLNYLQVIDDYSRILGKSNVGVFLFEELVNNRELFSRKLATFMSIDYEETKKLLKEKPRNTFNAVSHLRLWRRRIAPGIHPYRFVPPIILKGITQCINYLMIRRKGVKACYTMDQKHAIDSIFSKSNRQLQEKYDLNVGEYRYF